jgi:hypothetical protein
MPEPTPSGVVMNRQKASLFQPFAKTGIVIFTPHGKYPAVF